MVAEFPHTPEQARWYLAGVIDGEGHVLWQKTHVMNSRAIQITCCDLELIETSARSCDILRYNYKVYVAQPTPSGREVRRLVISKKETLRRLIKEVPIQVSKKRNKLERAVASYV